jgi:hypothetical protein
VEACKVITRINEAYAEEKPATRAGQNVAEAWRELGRTFNC